MGVEAAVYYCSTEQLSKILYNSWEVFGAESSFSEQKQPRVFYKKAVLKNFILKACNFINKRLQHMCFPVNIAKLLMQARRTGYGRYGSRRTRIFSLSRRF